MYSAKPYKSFERDHNNELWQADFKGDFKMANGGEMLPTNHIGRPFTIFNLDRTQTRSERHSTQFYTSFSGFWHTRVYFDR